MSVDDQGMGHAAEKALNPRFPGPKRPRGRPAYILDLVRIRERLIEVAGVPGGVTLVAKEFDVSPAWLYKHFRAVIL